MPNGFCASERRRTVSGSLGSGSISAKEYSVQSVSLDGNARWLAEGTRMINISPQYVSELHTELVEEGVLRRNGRELIIVDQSGLWHEIDFEELILNH
jgi:hypothetical protein